MSKRSVALTLVAILISEQGSSQIAAKKKKLSATKSIPISIFEFLVDLGVGSSFSNDHSKMTFYSRQSNASGDFSVRIHHDDAQVFFDSKNFFYFLFVFCFASISKKLSSSRLRCVDK